MPRIYGVVMYLFCMLVFVKASVSWKLFIRLFNLCVCYVWRISSRAFRDVVCETFVKLFVLGITSGSLRGKIELNEGRLRAQ